MLEFATPSWFLALPLPWLAWIGAARLRGGTSVSSRPAALFHSQADVLAELTSQPRSRHAHLPWLWMVGCVLLMTALARPQWVESAPNTYKGRDFLLAIDVSGSMRAQDFIVDEKNLSRLDMLKRVVNQFIAERHGDRIGLVVFADDAYTLAPLTSDMNIVRALLDEVRHGMAGEKTALGAAVALAVQRLQNSDAQENSKSRTLILLTDGSNTAGAISPDAAMLLAKQEGVRIYTVGIGSHRQVPFPRGAKETPAITEMPFDEDLLRRMAEQTGGHYYAADNTEEMRRIINDIEQLEKTDIVDDAAMLRTEGYWLPLIIGLALLLIYQARKHAEVLP